LRSEAGVAAQHEPTRLIRAIFLPIAFRRDMTSRDLASPLPLPLEPMEALAVDDIPVGGGWQYEPKWDGFRCLALREGDRLELKSKSGRPFSRYFPELVGALAGLPAQRFVLDGEIVVPSARELSFDALLQRIHPAPSRIERLARETPSLLVVFDLLVAPAGKSLTHRPLRERRRELEEFVRRYCADEPAVRLSPASTRPVDARRWLAAAGATLDGIIAKRLDAEYRPGERSAMVKIKSYRSADCVVGGFRYNEGKPVVGSLLLGLYDEEGLLHHVGFTSTIAAREKPELTRRLEALIAPPGFTGGAPGGPSRWSTRRSAEWQPLDPQLVVEVCYDHFSGGRFRHGTKLLRWRPDKAPRQCTLAQVAAEGAGLLRLLGRGAASPARHPARKDPTRRKATTRPRAARVSR
jgi:ATP-dependent DNA ligase